MFWRAFGEFLAELAPIWVVGLIFIALRLAELTEMKREERRQQKEREGK